MQYKVPQNIDLEDKIVGPLTLIQFLYVIGGGVIVYLLYMYLKSSLLFWVIGIPVALVALALAFLKIQDQPLSHFMKAGLVFLSRPRKRLWLRHGVMTPVVYAAPKKKNVTVVTPKRRIEKSELDQLAEMLDTRRIAPEK